jgi:hypothetical protein
MVTHSRAFLSSHSGESDEISKILGVDPDTVLRVKKSIPKGQYGKSPL